MSTGLSPAITADFLQAFRRYPEIREVLLFGSRAKGTFHPGSDIDLAVIAPTMSQQRFTALWSEVDALPIVFRIDLLHWDTLGNAALKEKILAEGQSFYKPAENPGENDA